MDKDPHRTCRSDYRLPAFRIDAADLRFELGLPITLGGEARRAGKDRAYQRQVVIRLTAPPVRC